jgi:hypothetical protein
MRATMPMADQAQDALVLIPVKPLIHAIWISWLQESVFGYPMRRMPFGNFEQSCAALSHMRQRVMMDCFLQRYALRLAEQDMPVMAYFTHLIHRKLLSLETLSFERLALPILVVKVH